MGLNIVSVPGQCFKVCSWVKSGFKISITASSREIYGRLLTFPVGHYPALLTCLRSRSPRGNSSSRKTFFSAVDVHRMNVMNEFHANFLNHLLYLPSLWSHIKKKIVVQDALMNVSHNSASVCLFSS